MTASIIASTITTIVVYLPLATMKGLSGQMFEQLGFTIVFAMLASLIAVSAFAGCGGGSGGSSGESLTAETISTDTSDGIRCQAMKTATAMCKPDVPAQSPPKPRRGIR